nr:hypothetical protein [Tanacetum cinerariifolium]
VKASKERLDVMKSLMACKPKLRASICTFVLEMKGYFDMLESLNMVFDIELSINIILSGIKKSDVPSTSVALVLSVGHNAKKRKTSHSNWKGKATKGKSDRGSKRKIEYEISPISDPKEADSYQFSFDNENGDILVYSNGCFIFKASPCKGIYETIECISNDGNVILNVGSSNELDKSKLWHSRLWHVNKKRIAQLQKDGVLESFDFKSDNVHESCLLGKMTKLPFTGTYERGEGLLDLVHTDVCGPFRSATKDGKHYYVMFTDDFSRYGYVYLIKHKSDNFEVFKRYQNEVENQLGKKIKLTPPRTPQLNGVAERRNRTMFDMGKRPSLGHIKIWGCEVFVRREAQYKLEVRSEKCLFISYPEKSFGYLFYKPKDNVLFVARRGVFLKREMTSKKDSGSKIDLEEIQESADEEPIINIDTQQEVVTHVEPDDISLPIRRTSSRVSKPSQDLQFYYGFHIKEDKINDSTLTEEEKISDSTITELNEPANYEEMMASLEAAKWKEAMKSKIQSIFRMENSKKGNLPLHHGIKISKDLCQKIDDELDKMSRVSYASAIGSIMYAMTYTRPDVSFALSMVSRHQQNPVEGHWTTVKNILTYLRNTKDKFLVYGGEKELRVTGYCHAACEASKEAIWMKNLIVDLGVVSTVQDPIEIFCDNESAVALTKEPKDHGKSKHIKRKYHFI